MSWSGPTPLDQPALTERLLQDAATALEHQEPQLALRLAVTALDTGPRTPTLWLRVDAIRREVLQQMAPLQLPPEVVAVPSVAPVAEAPAPIVPDISFAEPTIVPAAGGLYGPSTDLGDLYAEPEGEGPGASRELSSMVGIPEPDDALLVIAPSAPSTGGRAAGGRAPTGRVLEVADRRGNPERTSPLLVGLTVLLLIGAVWWYQQPEQAAQREALGSVLPASWRETFARVGAVGRPTVGVTVEQDLVKAREQLATGHREEARALAERVIAADSGTTEGWMIWLEASGWGSPDLRRAAAASRSATVDLAIADRWLRLGDTVSAAASARSAFTHVATDAQMRQIVRILELVGDTQTIERIRPYLNPPPAGDSTLTP